MDENPAVPLPRRRAVYTVLIGRYEPLLEQPALASCACDRICFTDDPHLVSDSWDVKLLPRPARLDAVRFARRIKILAHEYLPDVEESLYVDNAVLLEAEPERLFAELLPPGADMAVLAHSFRGRLAEEFPAVVEAAKDRRAVVDAQLRHYRAVAADALERQTVWTGLMLRRHLRPAVQTTMTGWWEEVLRFSRRDQLSLPVVLADAERAGEPLEWVMHRLDNRRSDYHRWPVWVGGVNPRRPDPEGEAKPDPAAFTALSLQVSALRAELAARVARVAELEASTSWRATAPLRRVTGGVSRVGAGLRARASAPSGRGSASAPAHVPST